MIGLLSGEAIVSPKVLLVLLLLVAIGYLIVHLIVNHKWGYTPKREKELEEKYKEK